MSDKLKQKGWEEMSAMLEKEMPISKKSQRRLIIFWMTLAMVLGSFIIIKHFKTGYPESNIKDNTIASISPASPATILNQSVDNISNISEIDHQNNANENNNFASAKTKNDKFETSEIVSLEKSLDTKDLNKIKRQIQSHIPVNQSEAFSIENQKEKQIAATKIEQPSIPEFNSEVPEFGAVSDIVRNRREHAEILNPLIIKFNYLNSLFPNPAFNEGLKLNVQNSISNLVVQTDDKPISKIRFGASLAIFKNTRASDKFGLKAGVILTKNLSPQWNIRLNSSISVQKINYDLHYDTLSMKVNNNSELFSSSNPILIFSPNQIWHWHNSIEIERNISKSLYISLDLNIPYIVKLYQKNDLEAFSQDLVTISSAINKQKVVNYNKWDVQPSIGLGYRINDNFSLECRYSHGLKSFVDRTDFAKDDRYYFRNFEFSGRYIW